MAQGTVRNGVLGLALLAALGAAAAAQSVVSRHYYVELAPYPRGGIPSSGTLDLVFRQSGGIVGFYRSSDGGLRPVSGQAYSSNRIELDFGGSEALHVNGTLKDGGILGRGYEPFSGRLYTFRGLPIQNDRTLPRITPSPWPNEKDNL